ncbi:alpha/beta fold hydrolase [Algoriphagus vanfongensis]|uniref:alpha/beta fold hydrolase n=1 Tax=Algoriphagus vanfongensis TaxID=426371 RepID=UPI000420139C|nr:alpha/beta hydrolase [Algoriphagus vanfongensis]
MKTRSPIYQIGKVGLVILLSLVFFLLLLYRNDLSQEELIPKYTYPESHFIEVDGVNLHVRMRGEGEPIVLLHGSFSSLHTWDKWQQELSPYFLTISIDLPGHGLTGPDPMSRYTVQDYSQFVLRLAEKLNLRRFHLVGNSMGGAVALQVANTRPDQVLSLNLIDASGLPKLKPRVLEGEEADDATPELFRWIQNPFVSQLLLKCTPRFLFAMNLKEVYGDQEKLHSGTIDRYFELMLRQGNRQATLERLNLRSKNQVDFSVLTMPSLIMWGDRDSWIPLSDAYQFQKLLPNTHLVVLEGVGHVPMEESPTESVLEYLSFLGVEVRKDYLQAPKYMTYGD